MAANHTFEDVLRDCWDDLEEKLTMEGVSGLVIYLYRQDCVTRNEKERIEGKLVRHERIRALLEILLSKDDIVMDHMLDYLQKDGTNRRLHMVLKGSAEARGYKWRTSDEKEEYKQYSNVNVNVASSSSTGRSTVNEAQAPMSVLQLWELIAKNGVALTKWHMVVPFLVTNSEDQLKIKDLLDKADYSGAVLKTLQLWNEYGAKKANLETVLRNRGLIALADSIWGSRD